MCSSGPGLQSNFFSLFEAIIFHQFRLEDLENLQIQVSIIAYKYLLLVDPSSIFVTFHHSDHNYLFLLIVCLFT